MTPEDTVQVIFGPTGLGILPASGSDVAIERSASVFGLGRRCRALVSSLPAGGSLSIVIVVHATGVAKVWRWLLLPLQLAAAARVIAERGVVVSRHAVAPDLAQPTVVYELASPAQRYAETFLLLRPSAHGLSRGMRKALARWAGCEPSAGAIVLVGRKR